MFERLVFFGGRTSLTRGFQVQDNQQQGLVFLCELIMHIIMDHMLRQLVHQHHHIMEDEAQPD